MKKAKDYSGANTLYFKPEINLCPHCGSTLKRTNTAWQKHIITLKQTFHVISYTYHCSNRACPQPQAAYRSAQAEMLSIKYYQFGTDVIAKIGHLRFNQYKTIRNVRQTLKANFRLNISRSEVDLLCQAYLALTTADRQQDTAFIEKIKKNGGAILAIDGAQPEKGNETLWIIKDVQTGETILARNLQSADKKSIATLLREVKALGIPVKGVVSDGQRSIRLAVADEFSGVPHQLCHFHYLRNIAKPISDMDRALKVDLKKKVRGIKSVEKKAALVNDQKVKVILRYCDAIREALGEDSVYPLKPGGLRLYRKLRKIRRSIQRSYSHQSDGSLERLLKLLSIIDELEPQYRRVRRLYKLIFEAGTILGQEANAEKVEANMLAYFEKLLHLRFRAREDQAAVWNILRYTASYWEGLFHHYDHTEIPRTNNDLERFIRSMKSGQRKSTGRASCQNFIVRYGAYVALLDPCLSQEETLSRLRFVGYGVFRLWHLKIRSFKSRLSFKRCLSRDLDGFLVSQELCWAKVAV